MDKTLRIVTAVGVWACALLLAAVVWSLNARSSDDELREHARKQALDAHAEWMSIRDGRDSVDMAVSEVERANEVFARKEAYESLLSRDITTHGPD
ncbi:MAG: hypothetical protein AAF916_09810 [Planctomycetota bacterium]